MTGSTTEPRASGPADREWWDDAIGRAIRAVWHTVGFYAAFVPPLRALTAAAVVGVVPTAGSVSLPVAIALPAAAAAAVLLSVVSPELSSARTLAFGFVAALLFRLSRAVLATPPLAGRPAAVVDAALAALGALALSAAVVTGFDLSDLRSGGSRS